MLETAKTSNMLGVCVSHELQLKQIAYPVLSGCEKENKIVAFVPKNILNKCSVL